MAVEIEKLIEMVSKAEIDKEVEAKLRATLKAAEVSDADIELVVASAALTGQLGDKAAEIIGKAATVIPSLKTEVKKQGLSDMSEEDRKKLVEQAKQEMADEEKKRMAEQKAAKEGDPLAQFRKEGGTLDLSSIPEAARPIVEAVAKSNEDLRSQNAKIVESAASVEKTIKELTDKISLGEEVKKAEEFSKVLPGKPEEIAKQLHTIKSADPKAYEAMCSMLTAASEVSAASGNSDPTTPIGKDGGEGTGKDGEGVFGKIQKEAKLLVAKTKGTDKELSYEDAVNKVLDQSPELYEEYNAQFAN